MQLHSVFTSDLVIVMDKAPLDSGPQESNTESYSRSLHASSTLDNFCREHFYKVSVVMKNFCYKNLMLFGRISNSTMEEILSTIHCEFYGSHLCTHAQITIPLV